MSAWIAVETPPGSIYKRLIIYTPTYDITMAYRIIPGDMFKAMTEATHWAYLTPPQGDK